MKNITYFILIILLSGIITGCKNKKDDDTLFYSKKYINEIKAVSKELGFYIKMNSIPGASIAIIKDGNLIYSQAFGLASKDLNVPVTRKTKFRIGEITEIFTSYIYLKMVEEGILNPDSSVNSYMPGFPEKDYTIRLKHLINCTSGIREPYLNEKDKPGYNISIEKGINDFIGDPLQSPPGMYQSGSMFDYNLLGVIMEKTTKQYYGKIFYKYITEGLNLENTRIDNLFITIKDRTDYYDNNLISQIINSPSRDLRFCAPSRGIITNAEDLAKFANAVAFTDILSAKTKSSLFEPVPLLDNYPSGLANGWILLKNSNGNPVYGRTGDITGGSSAVYIDPEQHIVVACVTNLNQNKKFPPVIKFAGKFIPDEKKGNKQ